MNDIRVTLELRISDDMADTDKIIKDIFQKMEGTGYDFSIEEIEQSFKEIGEKPVVLYVNKKVECE